MIFGFCLDSPVNIFWGLVEIVRHPDILLTDYIKVGGLGATFVNVGIVGMLSVLMLKLVKHEPSSYTIMTLWLVIAYSYFGKNPINVLPIIFGGYLFSKFVKESFAENALPILMSTALSPAVSQTVIMNDNWYLGLFFAILLGMFIGFVIDPIAKSCRKSHDGYNLYNMGFAAGILAMLIMAVFKGYGFDFKPVLIISSGNDFILTLFLVVLSLFLLSVGLICSDEPNSMIRKIFSINWSDNNFYEQIKEGAYINMGCLGLFIVLFLNLYGVSLSGPVIGATFTIIGFGCYGKTIRNIIPLMLGAILASLFSIHERNGTMPIITVLFSTCLAPIAGHFGFGYGILAGFMHFNLALNIGTIHGGLNLYNNGLAGGFVAMLLVPIIKAIKERKDKAATKAEVIPFSVIANEESKTV